MRIEKNDKPERRFGDREKPFHLTGEINQNQLFQKLKSQDLLNLKLIQNHIDTISQTNDIDVKVLVVGSAADVNNNQYGDIDLLVCPIDPHTRHNFLNSVKSALEVDDRFKIITQTPKGSALFYTDYLYEQEKIFVKPKQNGGPIKASEIDITFQDSKGGSYEDTLHFHKVNNLAFCILQS